MSTLSITYLGHSSVIIQVDRLTIYADPHLGRKALFFKRRREIPIPLEDLPKADAILISHAHYDHLDIHSFKYFSSEIPVLVPTGLSRFLAKFIQNPIVELANGSDFVIRDQLKIRAVPTVHRGGRYIGLRRRESTGFLVETEEGNVFFPGDTAYASSLRDVILYGPVAAAILPIGPIYPKWYMHKYHLSPDEALKLGDELDAKAIIPIHWGVFHLGFEGVDVPLDWLKDRLNDSPMKDRVVILEPGERWKSEVGCRESEAGGLKLEV